MRRAYNGKARLALFRPLTSARKDALAKILNADGVTRGGAHG